MRTHHTPDSHLAPTPAGRQNSAGGRRRAALGRGAVARSRPEVAGEALFQRTLRGLLLCLVAWLVFGTPRAAAADPPPEPPSKAAGGESAQSETPEEAPRNASSTVRWGLEIYAGLSTHSAYRTYTDGFWAGAAPWNASTAYVTWEDTHGYGGKVAIGLGETFNGREASHYQPAEAWLRVPVGPIKVTGGKYWTPFAGMEWQYESRPGVMLEWADSRNTASVSLHPNDNTNALNTYARIGRNVGGENTVGFSVGTGRGCSYDSPHSLGFGIDGAFSWRRWSLAGEHVFFTSPGAQRFDFSYARLEHAGPGRTTPFLAWYNWKDEGRAFGRYHSVMPGVQYQVNSTLSVEASGAATSERRLGWLQLHYTFE